MTVPNDECDWAALASTLLVGPCRKRLPADTGAVAAVGHDVLVGRTVGQKMSHIVGTSSQESARNVVHSGRKAKKVKGLRVGDPSAEGTDNLTLAGGGSSPGKREGRPSRLRGLELDWRSAAALVTASFTVGQKMSHIRRHFFTGKRAIMWYTPTFLTARPRKPQGQESRLSWPCGQESQRTSSR